MEDLNELKPCPFCGGEAELIHEHRKGWALTGSVVRCKNDHCGCKRLIDADALINKYGNWYVEEGAEEGFIGDLKHLIDLQPTVDAVPVIRCKDCVWRDKKTANCERFRKGRYVQALSYCSWAERKEE